MSQQDQSEMHFDDLEPIRVPVTLNRVPHALIEASEDVARKFRNRATSAARMEDGKVVRVEGAADVQAYLVSMCLFEVIVGKDGEEILRPVSEAMVRKLKASVVKQLFDRAKEISLLGEGPDVEPEMVGLCRKDLSLVHDPDRGGNPDVMSGINLALDWLKTRVKKTAEERAKNSRPLATDTST